LPKTEGRVVWKLSGAKGRTEWCDEGDALEQKRALKKLVPSALFRLETRVVTDLELLARVTHPKGEEVGT
jgi:hypothetical protein